WRLRAARSHPRRARAHRTSGAHPAACRAGLGPRPDRMGSSLRLFGGAAAVREALLLAGDEFEECGLPVLVLPTGAQDRVADLGWVLDPLAPAAEIAADRRVIAAEVARSISLVRQRHRMGLDRHRRVVEHDRRDRDAATHRGLEVEPGHPEGGVAHEVDAELVGGGDLGADREPQPGAELVRLAPADIAARPGRPVERVELFAWAAGIVGDYGLGGIDHPHELRNHPIRVNRALVRPQLGLPAAEPCLALPRELLSEAV